MRPMPIRYFTIVGITGCGGRPDEAGACIANGLVLQPFLVEVYSHFRQDYPPGSRRGCGEVTQTSDPLLSHPRKMAS